MRARVDGVGGNTQCHRISSAQIDQVERLVHGNGHMDKCVEIVCAQRKHSGVTIAAVANDCFEERNLEGLADIEHAEPVRRVLPRIGKSAWCEPEAERIRKPIEEDMVPDAASRRLGKRQ